MSTALAKAMQGEKVSETAAKGALSAAVDKLKNLRTKAESMKEKAGAVGAAALHIGEMQTTLFATSFAEGYFGEDKMKVGPVDVRAGAGLAGAAVGLYQTFNGSSAGGHVLAVSNGLLGAAVASFGRRAGASMAEKSKAAATPDAPPAPPAPAQLATDPTGRRQLVNPDGSPKVKTDGSPDFGGSVESMVRDILLTPDAAGEGRRNGGGGNGGGGNGGRRRPSRFLDVRARPSRDENDDA